ncbi:MAG: RimK family protein [Sulfuritalea sp.]|nr:RimK family protein [Sulfuritalea sp.]
MKVLVVVGNPKDWPLAIPGVSVLAARAYLTDPAWGSERGVQVYNLCKSYRYQSFGYYVSLLAEARGHKPLPRVSAIEDLQSQNLVRLLAAGMDDLVAKALAQIKSAEFTLSIYFGRNVAARYDALARQIFELFQAPLLRAVFARRNGGAWHVKSVRPIAASDIPLPHREFVIEAARRFLAGHRPRPRHQPRPAFDLAILHDRDNDLQASNARAIASFEKAARGAGIQTEVIGRADIGRLGRFDGLFIRDNTFIDHYTYRFSRRAAAEGLVVIDDPDSILRCNNKVYLAELLDRHGISAPKTLLVHRDNLREIVPSLGLPCVLKQPDSSLSLGVAKAESVAELDALVGGMLEKSDLIVAQEYLPTEFDWRVGILDRRPLFVCKYYMAPGHWQIVNYIPGRAHYEEGPVVALPLDEAPLQVIGIALKAANLFGDGFYGVDLKQVGRRYCVIEVNDNPNVDAGNEDAVLGDALYRTVMDVFARRMAERRSYQP